nr:hypothetical protein [Tanacetum cinerariifolium]
DPLFDEEIISIKIDLHHFNAESDLIESLLNHDSSIIYSSSKIDSLLDAFAGELTLLKSIPSGNDETDCYPKEEIRLTKRLLYDNSSPRPPEEFQEEKQIEEDQAAKAQNSKIPACCDDDDDYNFAITPNEPVDSPSMGDEHLDTILATESDEFIKFSVEKLVPNPSESEGENECDVPTREEFTTFSNVLFDADYEFDSVDDQLILFLMLAGELTLLKSIPSGNDETDCYPKEEIRLTKRLLYDNSSPRPPEEFVFENSDAEIEFFSP